MGGDTETIKDRLDIAEIVGAYVKLDKAGINWKGRCPFHSEKTPSFLVSPLRKSYYCFGCGAKGDIFTFVEEMEGVSFVEALRSLADRAGVVLKGSVESVKDKSEKQVLRQALEAAREFFENNLGKDKGSLEYLKSRGLDESSIREWRLGFALPEWRSLSDHLLSLGLDKNVLLRAGLVKSGEGNNYYDVFRNRIIFPLSDQNGEIVGFAGRGEEPKYLNSPDTLLFNKGSLLYGLDKAKREIRKKNYAVLVEGQVDLILSHQAGIPNTVASSGTAFTEEHLRRLKGLSPRIILAFDGDSAGLGASEKASVLALTLGLEVKIASLPEGKDPADLIKEDPNSWKEILRGSTHTIEFFLDRILEGEKDTRKAGKLIKEKLLPMISLLESSIERAHFISLINKKTGIKEEIIWEDMRKAVGSSKTNSSILTRQNLASTDPSHGSNPLRPSEFAEAVALKSKVEKIKERLSEVESWLKDVGPKSEEEKSLEKEKQELEKHLKKEELTEELEKLKVGLSQASTSTDKGENLRSEEEILKKIGEVHKELRKLEEITYN